MRARCCRTGPRLRGILLVLFGAVTLAAAAADPDHSAIAPGVDRNHALLHGPEGAAAAERVLADFYRRQDGEAGFAWWMGLPIAVRSRHAVVPEVRRWRYRVEFLRDAQRGDAAACRFSGAVVLRDPELGCDRAEQVRRYLDCRPANPNDVPSDLPGLPTDALIAQLDRDTENCPLLATRIVEVRARLAAATGAKPSGQ